MYTGHCFQIYYSSISRIKGVFSQLNSLRRNDLNIANRLNAFITLANDKPIPTLVAA